MSGEALIRAGGWKIFRKERSVETLIRNARVDISLDLATHLDSFVVVRVVW